MVGEREVSGLDLIRPAAWIASPYRLDFGDKLAVTLMAAGYPRITYNNFLKDFLQLEGMSGRISFYIEPIETSKMIPELKRRVEAMQANAYSDQIRGKLAISTTMKPCRMLNNYAVNWLAS